MIHILCIHIHVCCTGKQLHLNTETVCIHVVTIILYKSLDTKRSRFAYIHSSEAKSRLNILCHPKGYPLWHSKTLPLLKADVVVNMYHLARGKFHQEVVKVTVTQTNDVTNHTHDGSGAAVGLGH